MPNLSARLHHTQPRLLLLTLSFCALIFVFSCSALKLDKESNCLNEKSACFKADKTAPQYVQSVLPAPNAQVSTLPEIQLQFSEELNNPQPSDFTFTGGDLSMAITSVTKVDTYTYSLRTNHNPVVGGPLTLSFQNLKDYNGNKITNGTAAFTINLTIPITVDSASHYGISGVAPLQGTPPPPAGYQIINVSWHFSYSPVLAGNTIYTLRRSSAVDCSSGTNLTPVGTPAPNPAVGAAVATYDSTNATTISNTTYTFTLNKNDIPAGRQYILICVTNAANNKNGVQFIDITRDDFVPTMTLSPLSGIFASAKQLTFSCSDNFDRIAYGVDIKTDGSAPSAASISDPAFDPVTGALTSGTVVTANPFTIQTPYTSDPTKSIYKYRCIDTAGNPSVVYTSGVFDINSAYPTVNLVSVTKTGVTPAVAITGIGTGGYTSATLTWNTNQTGAAYEVRVDGSACNSGGTPLDSGAAGVTGTPSPAYTNKTAIITPATTGLALGLNTVRVCVFGAGVWAEDSFPLLLDNTAPTLAVNVPPASYGTSQSLVLSCSDNQDKVAFTQTSSDANSTPATPPVPAISADGVINPSELFTTPLLITTDVTGLKGKKTTVTWRCIDKAGHITAPTSATYTIDSLLPTITVQNQDHLAISTVAGAYQSTQITWVSDRSDLAYQLRRDSTNCTDGFALTSGTNLSAGTGVLVAGTPVTSTINSDTGNFPAGDAPHTVQICVTNYASNIGYTTKSLTLDSTAPTLPLQTPTISQVDATNFTVSWNASSDNNAVVGYRIYRGSASNTYPGFPNSPDYTATSTSITLTMPDANPYFLKIVPFDLAGNVPAAGAAYTEITTKPSITLSVTAPATGSTFILADGVASNTVTVGAGTTTVPWTTTLGTGATYNFAFSTQPGGQVCAMKELQFGTLNANKTLNINCVTGYTIGQNLNTASATKLGYRLFQGKNTAIAGSGTNAYANGTGAAASFNFPEYVAHSAGFLFVGDTNNHAIRKIDLSNNSVSIVAGVAPSPTPNPGSADGSCLSARFNQPMGIFADGTNLYIADFVNNIIRKVSDVNGAGCTVTTLAGTGTPGSSDGAANVAQFENPRQIVGNKDYLFVADNVRHRIRRISLSSGIVDTVIGNGSGIDTAGTGTGASIANPVGLTLIGSTLYASSGLNRIMSINIASGPAYGVATIVAGDGTAGYVDATGLTSRFNGIYTMTTDGVDLYIGEVNNHVIRRVEISQNFRVTTLAGAQGVVPTDVAGVIGANARFNTPHGIATDGRSLFIANHSAHTVRKLTDNALVGYWVIAPGVTPRDYSSDGAAMVNGSVVGGSLGTMNDRFGTANLASTLNGTSQYVEVADSNQLDLTNEYSLSAWVHPTAVGNNRIIDKIVLSTTTGYLVDIVGGIYRFIHGNTTAGAGVLLTNVTAVANIWTHVAATYSATQNKIRFYVNGHLVGEQTPSTPGATPTNALPLRIGADNGGAVGNFFQGAIADVRIFARALGEGEINELAQDASSTSTITGMAFNTGPTGLLSHYSFPGPSFLESRYDLGAMGYILSAGTAPSVAIGKDGDTAGAFAFAAASSQHLLTTPTAAALPSGAHPRTMCAWVSPAGQASGTWMSVVSYGPNTVSQQSGLALYKPANDILVNFETEHATERVVGSTPLPLNAWSHVCATLDNSKVGRVYLNGVLEGTATLTNIATVSSTSLYIGIDPLSLLAPFNGKIDDVRIYNNALSAIQIRQLAAQVPAGLLRRFDLSDAAAGGKAVDVAGWGENASIAGAMQSGDRFQQANQSYNFNGSGHSISASDAGLPTNTSPRTLCSWIRPTAYPSTFGVIVKYGLGAPSRMDALALQSSTGIAHAGYSADHIVSYKVPLNTWTHICGTFYSNAGTPTSEIFVNGASFGVDTTAGTIGSWGTTLSGGTTVNIGQPDYDANQRFIGDIDDVRIYNRVLTVAEVRALAGYHPMQASSWSSNVVTSSLKFSLQPEAATYAGGGCAGGANCVSAWNDTSGNNFNVTQATAGSQPVYDSAGINGKPAVRFIGAGTTITPTFLTGTCSAVLNSANSTFFAVLKEGNQSGNNGIFQSGTFAPGGGKLIYFINNPQRGPSLFDLGTGGTGVLNLWYSDGILKYNASGETVLMSLNFSGVGGNMYKNGAPVTTSQSITSGYSCGGGQLHLGRYYFGGGYPGDGAYFDGHIGDFVFFNQVLLPADRLMVECYLSAKYAVPLAAGVTCP